MIAIVVLLAFGAGMIFGALGLAIMIVASRTDPDPELEQEGGA